MQYKDKFFQGVFPSHQVGFDLFQGEWVSHIPMNGCVTGTAPLFDDQRPHMMIEHLGPIEGYRILELGPMEGHQTWQLERHGAGSITAIEGNSALWLRCLAVKNALNLHANFLLGDFLEYMRTTQERYDLLFASGVLYHMIDPVDFITLASNVAPRLFLWTHYFEKEAIAASDIRDSFLDEPESISFQGNPLQLYPRLYPSQEVEKQSYCGGILPQCRWMDLDGILTCLRGNGFRKIETFGKSVGNQGPSICITAEK